jgi:hypothetical protein
VPVAVGAVDARVLAQRQRASPEHHVVVGRQAEQRPAARKAAATEADVEARKPATPRAIVPPPTVDPPTSGSNSETPGAGDGVRELGDSVSSAIGDTGAATTDVTATLGPPVTETVQELLNLVNGLIEGATGGLGAALDSTLKR